MSWTFLLDSAFIRLWVSTNWDISDIHHWKAALGPTIVRHFSTLWQVCEVSSWEPDNNRRSGMSWCVLWGNEYLHLMLLFTYILLRFTWRFYIKEDIWYNNLMKYNRLLEMKPEVYLGLVLHMFQTSMFCKHFHQRHVPSKLFTWFHYIFGSINCKMV